jgi:hypothetical protein
MNNCNRLIILFLVLLLSVPLLSFAKVAKVKKLRGKVYILSKDKKLKTFIKKNQWIDEGVDIHTERGSFVQLLFLDKSVINIAPKSNMVVSQYKSGKPGIVNLLNGKIRSKVTKDVLKRDKNKLFIKTPTAAMGVRGTDFQIIYNKENKNTSLVTFSGNVWMAPTKNIGSLNNPAAIKKLNTISKSSTVVSVKKGQFSSATPKSKISTIPVKISPAQLNVLKKNDDFVFKKKVLKKSSPRNSNRPAKKKRSPIPKGVKLSGFVNSGAVVKGALEEKVENEEKKEDKKEAKKAEKINASTPTVQNEKVSGIATTDNTGIVEEKVEVSEKRPQEVSTPIQADESKPQGFIDEKTGAVAPPAGGFIDINTGIYIAPPEGSTFDANAGVFVPPPNMGTFDMDSGGYVPPEGLVLTATQGFVTEEKAIKMELDRAKSEASKKTSEIKEMAKNIKKAKSELKKAKKEAKKVRKELKKLRKAARKDPTLKAQIQTMQKEVQAQKAEIQTQQQDIKEEQNAIKMEKEEIQEIVMEVKEVIEESSINQEIDQITQEIESMDDQGNVVPDTENMPPEAMMPEEVKEALQEAGIDPKEAMDMMKNDPEAAKEAMKEAGINPKEIKMTADDNAPKEMRPTDMPTPNLVETPESFQGPQVMDFSDPDSFVPIIEDSFMDDMQDAQMSEMKEFLNDPEAAKEKMEEMKAKGIIPQDVSPQDVMNMDQEESDGRRGPASSEDDNMNEMPMDEESMQEFDEAPMDEEDMDADIPEDDICIRDASQCGAVNPELQKENETKTRVKFIINN